MSEGRRPLRVESASAPDDTSDWWRVGWTAVGNGLLGAQALPAPPPELDGGSGERTPRTQLFRAFGERLHESRADDVTSGSPIPSPSSKRGGDRSLQPKNTRSNPFAAREAPVFQYVCVSRKGMGARENMDRFAVVANFADDAESSFYAVFDGHGSSAAAEFAARRLFRNIESEWPLQASPRSKAAPPQSSESSGETPTVPPSARHRAPNSDICAPAWPPQAPPASTTSTSSNSGGGAVSPSPSAVSWTAADWEEQCESVKRAIRRGFRLTHDQFCASTPASASASASASSSLADTSLVGTTVVAAVVVGPRLVIAHAGDSRAILFQVDPHPSESPEEGNGNENRTTGEQRSTECLTEDHVPSLERENARLTSLGAPIVDDRVNGMLSVTRSIGDGRLCPWTMCEPDISVRLIHEDTDDMLLLATDGLWRALSEQDMVAALDPPSRSREEPYPVPSRVPSVAPRLPMRTIAERLVAQAALRNADDDCTALLIDLRTQRHTPSSRGESPGNRILRKRPREEADDKDDPLRKRPKTSTLRADGCMQRELK